MENVIQLNNTHNDEQSVVDQLASVKAQIADLTAVEKSLTDNLKEQGAGTYKGTAHYLVISESVRSTLNMKKVREKLSRQFIKANSKETKSISARLFGYSQASVA